MAKADVTRTPLPPDGPIVTDALVAEDLAALDEGFSTDSASPGTALVLGSGCKVRVEAGHLRVDDGEGWVRRSRRWNRATNDLSRLVLVAGSGYLSLAAVEWCKAAGVELVIVNSDGEPVFGPMSGLCDPRVLRLQAAPSDELATEAARLLLRPKLLGQAAIARDVLGTPVVADTLDSLAADLDTVETVDECRQREASSAAVYFNTWCDHPSTTLRFARADAGKVPAHWPTFGGRRSIIGGGGTPRKAATPLNAIANVAYHFGVVSARQAATVVGLHPGVGIIHADQVNKSALAFDLVEPIRPVVDRFILELVAERTFTRRDFTERFDGSIRLAPKLTQELAGILLSMTARAVAPHAEALAHLLGRAVAGNWQARTPLSQRNARAAQAKVKARKLVARARGAEGGRATATARRSDPEKSPALFATCTDCGAPLARSRHVRCPSCWERQPAQARDVRRRRGQAIAAARARHEAFEGDADPAEWERIAPTIASVPLSEIMDRCGVSKSSASGFRSGRHRPAPRHWAKLAELGRQATS